MNKIRFNHEPHDKQAKRIRQDNLRNKILFAQFLFIILITVSLIRFCNSFYFMDQSNIDKKEANKDNSNNEKPDDRSNIEIQTIVNVHTCTITYIYVYMCVYTYCFTLIPV